MAVVFFSSTCGLGAKRTLFFRMPFGAPAESVVVEPPSVGEAARGEDSEFAALPAPTGVAKSDVNGAANSEVLRPEENSD